MPNEAVEHIEKKVERKKVDSGWYLALVSMIFGGVFCLLFSLLSIRFNDLQRKRRSGYALLSPPLFWSMETTARPCMSSKVLLEL